MFRVLETRLKVPAVKAKEPVVLPRLVAAVPEVLMLVLPVTSRVLLRSSGPSHSQRTTQRLSRQP